MRKFTFTAVLLFITALAAFSQDYEIGIKFGPTLTYAKASTEGTNTNYDGDGSSAQFLVGAFVDFQFEENYFFSTGINYVNKDFGITARSTQSISTPLGEARFNQEYLQVPILLKLYTNEVILDTKVYFNFGIIPEIRLSSTPGDDNDDIIREFNNFDLAGNFGAGLERTIGVHTRVFVGFSYNLGFINQVKTQNNALDELSLKNRLFALELGVKF